MKKEAYIVGGKRIEAYYPEKTRAEDLERLYDICNELFRDMEECFYTKEEVTKLKKNNENEFLKKIHR